MASGQRSRPRFEWLFYGIDNALPGASYGLISKKIPTDIKGKHSYWKIIIGRDAEVPRSISVTSQSGVTEFIGRPSHMLIERKNSAATDTAQIPTKRRLIAVEKHRPVSSDQRRVGETHGAIRPMGRGGRVAGARGVYGTRCYEIKVNFGACRYIKAGTSIEIRHTRSCD